MGINKLVSSWNDWEGWATLLVALIVFALSAAYKRWYIVIPMIVLSMVSRPWSETVVIGLGGIFIACLLEKAWPSSFQK